MEYIQFERGDHVELAQNLARELKKRGLARDFTRTPDASFMGKSLEKWNEAQRTARLIVMGWSGAPIRTKTVLHVNTSTIKGAMVLARDLLMAEQEE